MIHPDTELRYINNEVGYGIVAKSLIPKGTITWVLDKLDREFTPMQIDELGRLYKEILDKYTYRNNKGNYVLCWDNARYVNHSFASTCLTTSYDFEVAVCDIHPGEQLTDDYGYLNITEPFVAMPERSTRKVAYPDDLLRYHKTWDKKLISTFRLIPGVQQPLRGILSDEMWQKINHIAAGRMQMDSILNCYYNPQRSENVPVMNGVPAFQLPSAQPVYSGQV